MSLFSFAERVLRRAQLTAQEDVHASRIDGDSWSSFITKARLPPEAGVVRPAMTMLPSSATCTALGTSIVTPPAA